MKNFTTQEHQRTNQGHVVVDNPYQKIAELHEKQKNRNFINGMIIAAMAVTIVFTGTMLGATTAHNNALKAKIARLDQLNQTQLTQPINQPTTPSNPTVPVTPTLNRNTNLNVNDTTPTDTEPRSTTTTTNPIQNLTTTPRAHHDAQTALRRDWERRHHRHDTDRRTVRQDDTPTDDETPNETKTDQTDTVSRPVTLPYIVSTQRRYVWQITPDPVTPSYQHRLANLSK